MKDKKIFNKITVVMPIYKDVECTVRAITSALPDIKKNNSKLILINDCSPSKNMDSELIKIKRANKEFIELISNEINLGFVKSVNKGMKAAGSGDIVILNSDVVTPTKWLSILIEESEKNSSLATLTPLSNNSTLSSLPFKDKGSDILLNYEVNEINNIFKNKLPLISVPTGVGFCMLITERCIKKIGYFNEELFGKGYGEENDFCQRAIKNGLKNYVTPNLYCHHIGEVSFGNESDEMKIKAIKILDRIHPGYSTDINLWFKDNPLKTSRLIRNLQISKFYKIPFILYLSHGLGGGTQENIENIIRNSNNSINIIMNSVGFNDKKISLKFYWNNNFIEEFKSSSSAELIEIFEKLNLDLIHLHHIAGLEKNILDWLLNIKIPLIVTYHDFYFINANPTLTYPNGEFCGIDAKGKDHDINRLKKPWDESNWKIKTFEIMKKAKLNIFPSNSSLKIYNKVFSEIPNSRVIPHEIIVEKSRTIEIDECEYLRIGILGALSAEKGAYFLEKIADYTNSIQLKNKKIKFILIGYSFFDIKNVEITGYYEKENLPKIIKENNLDGILFLARWPETFSYTLSTSIASNIPIIAPDIGAFPERLFCYSDKLIYPLDDSHEELAKKISKFVSSNKKHCFKEIKISPFYKNDYYEYIKKNNINFEGLSLYESFLNISSKERKKSNKLRSKIADKIASIYKSKLFYFLLRKIPKKYIWKIRDLIYGK